MSFAVVGGWIGGCWRNWVIEAPPTFSVCIGGGLMQCVWETPWSIVPTRLHEFSYGHDAELNWWFSADSDRTITVIRVPMWALAAVSVLPTWWLWRRTAKPAPPGHCSACAYDRRGIAADTPCPECGAAPNRN